MSASAWLPDVHVLLSPAWLNHVHLLAAHRRVAENHGLEGATCPLTQLGFGRLSMPQVPMLFGDVMEALARMTVRGAARFVGHPQFTDAVLLELAMRDQGGWQCGAGIRALGGGGGCSGGVSGLHGITSSGLR